MASPDGNAVARVVASNCGGALGTARTSVSLEDRSAFTFLPRRFRTDPVFTIRATGLDQVEVTWISATELVIRFQDRPHLDRVQRQKTSWKYVTITYEPVEYQP